VSILVEARGEMKRTLRISHSILPILALLSGIVHGDEQEAFTESVVIFNTICAKCHEAQCSGRLSFADAIDASSNHIVRHYEDASGKRWLQEQLFAILNHMKAKCAYYPMDVPVPPQRVWGPEILQKLSTYLEKNYFVPVGRLTTGDYRLELDTAKDEKMTVQVVSERFTMVVEDCFDTQGGRLTIPFSVDEAGNHYVRVYPRTPLRLMRLAVVSVDSDEK